MSEEYQLPPNWSSTIMANIPNIVKYNPTICAVLLLMFSSMLSAQAPHQAWSNPLEMTPPPSEFASSEHAATISAQGRSKNHPDRAQSPPCPAFAASANDVSSHEWQTERAVGKKLAEQIEKEETIIGDPVLTQYLNDLERAIAHNSQLRDCFVVKLIHDVEPNAYALPGGFLYVTSGLILISHSESELTAALAHETAHVSAEHFARIEHKRQLWGHIALAGGPAGYLIRRVAGPLLTRKLIRNAEFEADRLCLKYQSASGYDPTQFKRLLQTTLQDDSASVSFVRRLFATHPSTAARIKRLDRIDHRLFYSATNYIVDTSNFHEFKQHLSSIVKVVDPDLAPANEH